MFKKGFTFIEILLVVTIIAVLAAIGVVSYVSANKQSRDTRRKADLEQLRSALELYRSDNGTYVDRTVSGGAVISTSLSSLVSTYVSALPVEPKPSPYVNYYYENIGVSNVTYCLYAKMENTSSCTATGCSHTGYDYCVKNP